MNTTKKTSEEGVFECKYGLFRGAAAPVRDGETKEDVWRIADACKDARRTADNLREAAEKAEKKAWEAELRAKELCRRTMLTAAERAAEDRRAADLERVSKTPKDYWVSCGGTSYAEAISAEHPLMRKLWAAESAARAAAGTPAFEEAYAKFKRLADATWND